MAVLTSWTFWLTMVLTVIAKKDFTFILKKYIERYFAYKKSNLPEIYLFINLVTWSGWPVSFKQSVNIKEATIRYKRVQNCAQSSKFENRIKQGSQFLKPELSESR